MAHPEHIEILQQGVANWNEWREQKKNVKPNLEEANLSGAKLNGADLIGASLIGADLSGAKLNEADLFGVSLIGASLIGADLRVATLRSANLRGVKLNRAKLSGADLGYATLGYADLSGADLRVALLRAADLTGANLIDSQALFTNFSEVRLTAACIALWGINEQTKFTDAQCDYIYLGCGEEKRNPTDRRPHNPDEIFAPGDFARLMEQARETVDLIFSNGIDWRAFLTLFQNLQVSGEHGELLIQGINRKSDGSFVISVEASEVSDEDARGAIAREFKTQYESELKRLEAVYQTKLQAQEREIAIYREQSASMTEIVKMMANRPINVEAKAVAESNSEPINQQFTGTVYGVAGKVEGDQIINAQTQQKGASHLGDEYKYSGLTEVRK